MSPFSSLPRRLAADAYEASVENAIVRAQDLYELDGETLFRNRGGCIETGTAETFGREVW
jgi:hypothetical protein